jgi:fatty acyl-CoA reductase
LVQVQRIYVLARPKGAHSPQQRVTALLHKALFHQVRTAQGLPALLQRVVAVPGDLTQPGLGLSPADEKMLQQEVTIILHSAASIELAAEIQRTLRWVCEAPNKLHP